MEDRKGIDGRFVVKKIDGRVGDVEFDAVASDGRMLKTQQFGD